MREFIKIVLNKELSRVEMDLFDLDRLTGEVKQRYDEYAAYEKSGRDGLHLEPFHTPLIQAKDQLTALLDRLDKDYPGVSAGATADQIKQHLKNHEAALSTSLDSLVTTGYVLTDKDTDKAHYFGSLTEVQDHLVEELEMTSARDLKEELENFEVFPVWHRAFGLEAHYKATNINLISNLHSHDNEVYVVLVNSGEQEDEYDTANDAADAIEELIERGTDREDITAYKRFEKEQEIEMDMELQITITER